MSVLSPKTALGAAAWVVMLGTPVGAGLLACTVSSNVFTEDFEKGVAQWGKELCCKHSAQIVSSPVRAGNKALKFTYRKSDYTATGKKRAELRGKSAPVGSERWYNVSVFVPTSFTKTEGPFIITQFHSRPDEGERWTIPTLFLKTDGQNLKLANQWDARKTTPKRNAQGRQSWDLGPLPKGRWVNFVYHIKWSYKSDGVLEVFQDGKRVVSKTGPNCYNNKSGTFMKIGLYASDIRSHPQKYDFDQQEIYFDEVREVRIGDGSARQEAITPRL